MHEERHAGGDIIVDAKIRVPEDRVRFWHLLESLPGERVSSTIYEVDTEEWDDGLWEQELTRMAE